MFKILWRFSKELELEMNKFKKYLKDNKMTVRIISTIIGAALGFAYYKFVGCRSGACPITSNPYVSTIWGGLIGFLMSG